MLYTYVKLPDGALGYKKHNRTKTQIEMNGLTITTSYVKIINTIP